MTGSVLVPLVPDAERFWVRNQSLVRGTTDWFATGSLTNPVVTRLCGVSEPVNHLIQQKF